MSTLYVDTDVWMVIVTLQKKDGSGSTTYNLGKEFYPASGVYSGSGIIYPVLAELPTCPRSCGLNSAIRHNVTLRIQAHTPLSNVNTTFLDLLTTHNYQNGVIQIRYYPKPDDAVATDAAANIRQTLEIVDIGFGSEENILEIQARDTWFKDKRFGVDFISADFLDNVSDYEDKWKGECAPVAFGDSEDGTTGVIVSACPVHDSNLPSTYQSFNLCYGITSTTMSGAGQFFTPRTYYVANPFRDLDPRDYLPLSMQSDIYPGAGTVPLAGPTTLVVGTNFPMYQWRLATKYTPGTTARMISSCTARIYRVGTIAAGTGQLMISVYKAVQVNGTNWATVGSVLGQATYDAVNLSTSAANVAFFFEKPLILPPNHYYFFILEWTNTTDTANYVMQKYDTADTSDPVYTNDQLINRDGWTETAGRHQLQIWDYGTTSNVTGTDIGSRTIMNNQITTTGTGTNPYYFGDVDFKVGLAGLWDDSSGTYSGSASSTMNNAAAFIHFLLRDSTFGANVSSSYADYTAIDAVRTILGVNLKIAFVQETPASVADMINEICRQSRLRLYKTRAGKMSLNFPVPLTGTYTADITEADYRGDFRVISVTESPDSDLINSIDVLYAPDAIGVHSDAALNRKVRDQKYLELEYIRDGSTGESATDTARGVAATASIALYGTRAAVWRFDMHNRSSTVKKVLNYYFDRYSKQRQILTCRIPMKTWYSTLDLFSTFRGVHQRISNTVGSRGDEPAKVTDGAGSTALIYNQGVLLTSLLGGTHTGEIMKIEESGAYMTITVESVNSFEGYV